VHLASIAKYARYAQPGSRLMSAMGALAIPDAWPLTWNSCSGVNPGNPQAIMAASLSTISLSRPRVSCKADCEKVQSSCHADFIAQHGAGNADRHAGGIGWPIPLK